jgi:hypothetical protein
MCIMCFLIATTQKLHLTKHVLKWITLIETYDLNLGTKIRQCNCYGPLNHQMLVNFGGLLLVIAYLTENFGTNCFKLFI